MCFKCRRRRRQSRSPEHAGRPADAMSDCLDLVGMGRLLQTSQPQMRLLEQFGVDVAQGCRIKNSTKSLKYLKI